MTIPPTLIQGPAQPYTLIHYSNRHRETRMRYLEGYICGHRIPPFHQPLQWSTQQQQQFIENVWLGLGFGQLVITIHPERAELSRLVIDGQHRLTALQNYLDNEFPVFGQYWRDLSISDQMRFEGIPAPTIVLSQDHELEDKNLRDIYERLNFSKIREPELV
ncbi:DUF262 domain-containing protein [Deinococcus cellulosilyticus]|uniref:GmrSD restriction endonucleases N-terminal domain-containing protein n=1 Tax=Deinococcus cellulosilyticus (strain DSM 18568 / NBRC 106333 / KACC 11606 / 5516J-15) TaxID=1223518 RepID=A0A511MXG5_DEIC1|nr:DUF262 domain-containing protein [Deinococcus cellulosilyticus]GEM45051.1 hypothetical protein DC3_06860 [Deinococcus cellulosilyticus NBRC 106333 = KACC 11606]